MPTEVAVALISAGSAISVALIGSLIVRRPMKREHQENAGTLGDIAEAVGHVAGQVDVIVGQVETTEGKIDDHIADHARGEFRDDR